MKEKEPKKAEAVIKYIRRRTKRKFSSEENKSPIANSKSIT